MNLTFILFISYQSWLRYGRKPHYSELRNFGNLSVVEEPFKIFSREFLLTPLKAVSNYFKFSLGIRVDDKYGIKVVRPILLFSSKIKNISSLCNKIDNILLKLQLKKIKKENVKYIYMLTNRYQEWVTYNKGKNFYYLDIDDEWSMINYNKSIREIIEKDIRRLINKVDIATGVTIQLAGKYNEDNKVFFLPNAVDTNHYVPDFDKRTSRVKEKNINELSLDKKFLEYEKNDQRIYLTSLEKMNELKKPMVGSISGLAGNWSDFKFISRVEELLPIYFTMVSSGNIHSPTFPSFFEDYKNYLLKQRMIYLGYVDYSILPDFLKFLDVGIVMHRMDAFNKHSAPNKIWAYLAMGLPVVS